MCLFSWKLLISRVLDVDSNARVHISNVTMTGGDPKTVYYNVAFGDYGGGIYNRGELTLTNCTVTRNHSHNVNLNSYGGGVYNYKGKLTMINCTVSNNSVGSNDNATADGYGGGIANYNGVLFMENSTVNNNTAIGHLIGSAGGGIYNYGTAFMTNTTVVGNTADRGGGLLNHGDAEVVSSTFARNQGLRGGGMFLYKSLDLWNTIVGDNPDYGTGPDVYGHVHSGGLNNPRGGHNLIGNTSESSGWVSTAAGGTDLTNSYIGLADLANNGGPTQTMALYSNSSAIGKGVKVHYAGTKKPLLTDQRGLLLDSPPDIGAFQTQKG
jgi:hypothetical protein